MQGFTLQRLYGGDLLSASEVDAINDYIPIRDASVLGDSKHKKISVKDLKSIIGAVVVTGRDPRTGDILPGNTSLWQNTNTNQVYNYANIGGVLWRSTIWTRWTPSGVYTADLTTIFADNTILTADLT